MFDRYISVVIIPRRTSEVKKLKIPVFLVGFAGILIVGLLGGLAYIGFDYFNIRTQVAELDQLVSTKEQQESKIQQFDERFDNMQVHFDYLIELSDKLKAMAVTSISSQRKSNLQKAQEEALKTKLEIAKKTSILDAIATDTSEIDSDQKYERELRFTSLISFFKTHHNPFERIPSGLPISGYLIDEFGMHADAYGQLRTQSGISIASRLDFPINAPASGIVLEIDFDENFGNLLVLDHGNGFKTRYGHIGRYEVDIGDVVEKGNVVALVGNSGRTTGPRLYYEILFNEVPQNPVKYLNN